MQIDSEILCRFTPLNELTANNLREIADKTQIESLAKGKTLFRKGDTDNSVFFLLKGAIILVGDEQRTRQVTIHSNSSHANFPIDHCHPRRRTAIADSNSLFFRINRDLLDIMLAWDQSAGYQVDDLEETNSIQAEDSTTPDPGDWMSMLLRSEIFHRIPPGNVQQILMSMEAIQVKAGEQIVTQGEDGDYYYFIKSGYAQVTHIAKSGKEMKLAALGVGSSFGEEALISDERRNANVTMLSNGVLMRMSKRDFVQLLKAPILRRIDYREACNMVNDAVAIWLDVRLASEYKSAHIAGSINIPIYMLRIKAETLDEKQEYIVYCNTGKLSSAATYLLNERGLNACCLNGGLRGLSREQLSGLRRSIDG